jgi:hypothetical protein
MEKKGVHIGFWRESWKEGDHYKDLGVGARIILKCIFEK